MAFCKNCGSELKEGKKFCENCGVPVEGNGNAAKQAGGKNFLSVVDQFGQHIGIVLFILSIITFMLGPAFVKILLSALIITGAIFCFARKYKLKVFNILALIAAAICLIVGVSRANSEGLFGGKRNYMAEIEREADEETEKLQKELEQAEKELEELKKDAEESAAEEVAPAAEKPAAEPEETVTDDKASDADQAAEPEADDDNTKSNGVDPALKAFLDGYEEFIDEYVDFMKKYKSDPGNAVSMIGEYSEIMLKYTDFMEKVDKYDPDQMSMEDAKYYLEVTSRCAQKALSAL